MLAVAYASIVIDMNTVHREAIAGEVRAAMARKRVTQAQLARRIGVSRASLSERLNGLRPFDTDQLVAICAALDTDLLSLFPEQVPA